SNEERWQDIHWKSIQSAYSSSPFFEFFEDDLKSLFIGLQENLMEFNFKSLQFVLESLQLDINFTEITEFNLSYKNLTDYRYLVESRKEVSQPFKPYVQVFDDKHGFIPNLSILDLIFNEGPAALLYLERQQLPI